VLWLWWIKSFHYVLASKMEHYLSVPQLHISLRSKIALAILRYFKWYLHSQNTWNRDSLKSVKVYSRSSSLWHGREQLHISTTQRDSIIFSRYVWWVVVIVWKDICQYKNQQGLLRLQRRIVFSSEIILITTEMVHYNNRLIINQSRRKKLWSRASIISLF